MQHGNTCTRMYRCCPVCSQAKQRRWAPANVARYSAYLPEYIPRQRTRKLRAAHGAHGCRCVHVVCMRPSVRRHAGAFSTRGKAAGRVGATRNSASDCAAAYPLPPRIANEARTPPVRSAHTHMYMYCWCVVNRIACWRTVTGVQCGSSIVSAMDGMETHTCTRAARVPQKQRARPTVRCRWMCTVGERMWRRVCMHAACSSCGTRLVSEAHTQGAARTPCAAAPLPYGMTTSRTSAECMGDEAYERMCGTVCRERVCRERVWGLALLTSARAHLGWTRRRASGGGGSNCQQPAQR